MLLQMASTQRQQRIEARIGDLSSQIESLGREVRHAVDHHDFARAATLKRNLDELRAQAESARVEQLMEQSKARRAAHRENVTQAEARVQNLQEKLVQASADEDYDLAHCLKQEVNEARMAAQALASRSPDADDAHSTLDSRMTVLKRNGHERNPKPKGEAAKKPKKPKVSKVAGATKALQKKKQQQQQQQLVAIRGLVANTASSRSPRPLLPRRQRTTSW